MPETSFTHVSHLPEHQRLLIKISDFFRATPDAESLILSGSTASGGMDEYSDLDVGIICADADARERLWKSRWDWEIAPWFHRFDADHIKSFFVIYFFEPSVHVDFNFYTPSDLPSVFGAPYSLGWSKGHDLTSWMEAVNRPETAVPDWGGVQHNDERFWAWTHYCASHAARGEYYDCVTFLKDLRGIVEDWEAKLLGKTSFTSRRAEEKYPADFMDRMRLTFCRPQLSEIKVALQNLVEVQLNQRQRIAKMHAIKWKTSPSAIQNIRSFVESL